MADLILAVSQLCCWVKEPNLPRTSIKFGKICVTVSSPNHLCKEKP